MLVTDQAKLIRLPLESLRVIGRGSAGVRLFNVADEEHVVSAVRLADEGEDEGEVEAEAAVDAGEMPVSPDDTPEDGPNERAAGDGLQGADG